MLVPITPLLHTICKIPCNCYTATPPTHTVQCAYSRPTYFAERLYYSMKGAGTDDSTLVRVVVSRSEVGTECVTFVHYYYPVYRLM